MGIGGWRDTSRVRLASASLSASLKDADDLTDPFLGGSGGDSEVDRTLAVFLDEGRQNPQVETGTCKSWGLENTFFRQTTSEEDGRMERQVSPYKPSCYSFEIQCIINSPC